MVNGTSSYFVGVSLHGTGCIHTASDFNNNFVNHRRVGLEGQKKERKGNEEKREGGDDVLIGDTLWIRFLTMQCWERGCSSQVIVKPGYGVSGTYASTLASRHACCWVHGGEEKRKECQSLIVKNIIGLHLQTLTVCF